MAVILVHVGRVLGRKTARMKLFVCFGIATVLDAAGRVCGRAGRSSVCSLIGGVPVSPDCSPRSREGHAGRDVRLPPPPRLHERPVKAERPAKAGRYGSRELFVSFVPSW